jgi:hypothetical protein
VSAVIISSDTLIQPWPKQNREIGIKNGIINERMFDKVGPL